VPDFIQPLLDAVAHQEAGRLAAAAAGYATVLEIEPEQPQALLFAGVLACKTGQTARAVDLLERAVAVRPTHAEAQFAFGNALWTAGLKPRARDAWAGTLRHDCRHVGALLNLARAQEEAGETDDAVETCRQAVEARPEHALPRAALAAALRAAGQLDPALAEADLAVAYDPHLPQAHYQRGTTLKALGQAAKAADALRHAVRLAPDDASSQLNLANTLHDLGDPAAAEHHCRAAIAADPAMAEAHSVLGLLLTQAGQLDAAIAACAEAVRLAPDMAEAHWNMGIALLTDGQLQSGFACYEWRKRHPKFAHEFRTLPTPEWRGGPIAGKRLLILTEQGLGDAIMLARYAAPLAAAGAEVTIACDRKLVPLLRTAAGVSAAVANAHDLPDHDLWVDQMSLPLLCGTTLETIPSPGPYLAADPPIADLWRLRLPDTQNLRVGVAWAGNPLHSNDANRSCPIASLKSLATAPGIDLVSLQVGPRAAEASVLRARDMSPLLTDYAQTAGLIDRLDVVVTVDTSVAHLAAAMGKPTFIMLPHCPDWRWLAECGDSPWYASVRLVRQPSPGDWDSVRREVIDRL